MSWGAVAIFGSAWSMWRVEFQSDRLNEIFHARRDRSSRSRMCESKWCVPAQLFRDLAG